MRIVVDYDIKKAVSGIGIKEAISMIEFKRGDSARIELQFVSGTTVLELTEPTSAVFGVKADGAYDSETYLVSAMDWTKEGSGATTLYVFTPSFNTTELDEALNANNADDTDDLDYVDAMLEIEWVEDGLISSTQTIIARIWNDVIKGGEGAPTDAPGMDAYLSARTVRIDQAQTLTAGEKEQVWVNLGLTAYDDLTAANAALAPGLPYYDRALERMNNTTA